MERFAFLDLEGVLYPEIWEIYAHKLGLPELGKTTREEPDFKKLVSERIKILKKNNVQLQHLSTLSKQIKLLDGALDFVKSLQKMHFDIYIVTDAFLEIIGDSVKNLEVCNIYPNHFTCDESGYITDAIYMREKGKYEVLEQILKEKRNAYSIAIGDTFNDFTMLDYADDGFLFNPSQQALLMASPNFRVVRNYDQITEYLKGKLE
ncbi:MULTISPECIES: bifunctional phosphoserine phosphatase/homoserine phosphotransferase ThrH [Neisseria]|uniref:phosphoserine phosphatase n=1 Tax=Neisseria dumasiana TaxID=1931275 RepID=A0ABX3WI49_9NEIS|nr:MULTISPECIES: bifunctional phosphoserine phosphatase/homoserine phosphotransferase ThrH [Neisseria]KPN72780.1 hypothetical protein AKG43_11525 [Neisseria sp. 74A18]OSI28330.1 phosphoserine phosphatase [Neisseria dumasiana]UOO83866.1 bifunctional phosphoserine phosphatase/homoserine phosphotransferase ThrH [Neisseria dumasiana]